MTRSQGVYEVPLRACDSDLVPPGKINVGLRNRDLKFQLDSNVLYSNIVVTLQYSVNCSGLLTQGLVSIVNPAVLCDPRLVESADAEPGMQRSRGCGEYMRVSDCVENQCPDTQVVRGSTVYKYTIIYKLP